MSKTSETRWPDVLDEDGNHLRTCSRCQKTLKATIEFFHANKKGKYGLNCHCRQCAIEQGRQWIAENKKRKAARDKAYAERNAEKIADYQKEYRKENRDKARDYIRDYCKERSKTDPEFRLKRVMTSALVRMIKGTVGKTRHLPYSMAELRRHMERQFLPGMNWENYGEWHIDHIRPIASFSIGSVDHPDFLQCWGLPNLRPLWAKDNMAKKAKRVFLI